MKVILLQDVAKIGRRSQIVEVPDGYARNQLIPKRMAEPASAANTKRIEKLQANVLASGEADKQKFSQAIEALRSGAVKVGMEVNEKGHTFKAVSASDVVSEAKKVGIIIDENMILIESPIKELGEHSITLSVGKNKAEFTIEVIKK